MARPQAEAASKPPLGEGLPLTAHGDALGTFPVAERFLSINGEGPRAGRLAAFVRFQGCNLACAYCDTAWANEPDCPVERLSAREIAGYAASTGARHLTLTGGEPLLQPGIGGLLALLMESHPLAVEIETNGAVSLEAVAAVRDSLPESQRQRLSFTLDCKLPSSGMQHRMVAGNYRLLAPYDTVKFVIGDECDFPAVLQVLREYRLSERCQVYLGPVFGQMDPARIVDFMQENHLYQATLQLQLHKIIWPGVEKGV